MDLSARNESYASLDYTTELLRQLDKDVPGYSSHRNLYLVGLFTMASFAIPLNLAAVALLVQRHFWRSNVYILLFQVKFYFEKFVLLLRLYSVDIQVMRSLFKQKFFSQSFLVMFCFFKSVHSN